MTSEHKRNVDGMHQAGRCQALTHTGAACGSPAVKGKTRCWRHGGKASRQKSWGRQFGDYTKANLAKDRQIRVAVKAINKEIRKLWREGGPVDVINRLSAISADLLAITQQTQDSLIEACSSPESEQRARRAERDTLTYLQRHQPDRRGSPELVRDRALGAILGLAVGEAIGITLQGEPRDEVRCSGDMQGGGPFGLGPGQWGSATATTLALLDSLNFRRCFDEADAMERLCDWHDEGAYSCTGSCTGIDETTREAIATYRLTGDPIAGDDHPDCLGSGGIVRLAPFAIRYCHNREELRRLARLQGSLTHRGYYALDACEDFAMVLADAIQGLDRKAVLRARDTHELALLDSVRKATWKARHRDEIVSRDNVLTSLEAAMWCLERTDNFEDAVLQAANLGGESGIISALTGQLAGASYGASTIPARWLEQLAWHNYIAESVEALLDQHKLV